MNLCNVAHQEFNRYTMRRMSINKNNKSEPMRLYRTWDGTEYYTLDAMSKPSHDKLKPIRFYGERRCGGVTNIVKPVYKSKGKIISPVSTEKLIRSCGFLYALAYVQKILETNALLTMNLRQMTMKGCDYDDY